MVKRLKLNVHLNFVIFVKGKLERYYQISSVNHAHLVGVLISKF